MPARPVREDGYAAPMPGNGTVKPSRVPLVVPPRADPLFHVVLYEPEIPQNAGNVGRLCLGVQARLHLVHPLGFAVDERAVRRAGLDYWRHVDLQEHADADAFWAWAAGRAVYPLTARGGVPYTRIPFAPGDVFVFGRESVGLPPGVVEQRGGWTLPMVGATRSLNLANAVSVVAYSAFARLRPDLFGG